ncbi:MAG TPA: winged helix-turn-helix domain-containing protein [Dehalococcoidia bacterium]|nr:winged helix-turn-helix domain-containing protein [Dehalococcoidia bacterium]
MRCVMMSGGDPGAEAFGGVLAAHDDAVLKVDAETARRSHEIVRFDPDVLLIRAPGRGRPRPWVQSLVDVARFGGRPVLALLTGDEFMVGGTPAWAHRPLIAPYDRATLVHELHLLGMHDRAEAEGVVLRCGDVELNEVQREVHVRRTRVELTFVEFELLAVLLQRRGEVVSRRELIPQVSRRRATGERAVDVCIHRLREKLSGANGFALETVRFVGYRCVSTPRPV